MNDLYKLLKNKEILFILDGDTDFGEYNGKHRLASRMPLNRRTGIFPNMALPDCAKHFSKSCPP